VLLLVAVAIASSIAVALGGWVVLATDRAEPAVFGRRELAVAAREGCLRLVLALISPFGWSEATVPGPSLAARQVPVLLVPGLGRNRSVFLFLATYLANHGFARVWAANDPRGDLSIPERAADLKRRVDALILATGSDRVDVVAHSTGGLVAAWYLRHLDGAASVRRLVTLGTPWAGTRTAVFTRGRVGPELLHGNPLLSTLVPPPVPTVAIWSPDDPVVIPSASAAPSGTDNVQIDGVGHLDMLGSALVFRAVEAALTRPA
jgi:triacylglycerol lipase